MNIEVLYDEPLHADDLPPGKSLADENTVIRKGDILAYYNQYVDLWNVKRVVRAGRADSSYSGQVRQSDIKYVTHDAQPIEGKDGTASSHYPSRSGFGETRTYELSSDGGRPWYLVDMTDPGAQAWIDRTDELWEEYKADQETKERNAEGTPAAFEARMAARAKVADQLADQAQNMARTFRDLADQIRNETRGRWIK